MFNRHALHSCWKLQALLCGALALFAPCSARGQAETKESPALLRIICVAALNHEQEVVIASRNDEGTWQEHGGLKLRSSSVSGWLPARSGPLHLTVRGTGDLSSICSFTYPAGERRALLILLPDTAKNIYHGDLIIPGKLKFAKGSTLLVNYSPLPGTVVLGSRRTSVKPGERLVVRPEPDKNGMFRMLVAYTNEDKQLVPCYDRYVGKNPEARDLLLLFPDPVLGLRSYRLPEFGPFE